MYFYIHPFGFFRLVNKSNRLPACGPQKVRTEQPKRKCRLVWLWLERTPSKNARAAQGNWPEQIVFNHNFTSCYIVVFKSDLLFPIFTGTFILFFYKIFIFLIFYFNLFIFFSFCFNWVLYGWPLSLHIFDSNWLYNR